MRAVIFANGCLNFPQDISQYTSIHPDDLVIAADGGARHCLALGIHPRLVIGDLDSLGLDDLSRLKAYGAEIVQHPIRKDYTDLELALRYAQEQGADEILVLGALGDRWDQTIANILLPAILSPQDDCSKPGALPRIRILDGNQEIFFVHGGDQLDILGKTGDLVSLIPISEYARGVTTQNLEYPLYSDDLRLGSTLGISNVLSSERGWVTLKEGLMLCVVIHSIK